MPSPSATILALPSIGATDSSSGREIVPSELIGRRARDAQFTNALPELSKLGGSRDQAQGQRGGAKAIKCTHECLPRARLTYIGPAALSVRLQVNRSVNTLRMSTGPNNIAFSSHSYARIQRKSRLFDSGLGGRLSPA
jgi:hypothetical protein